MTEPLNFFYFLVYKRPVSVLISRGQNFRTSETGRVKIFSHFSLQALA